MNDTADIQAKTRKGKGIRRCIVHIGLNKTGSTTIQGWLAANRDALEAQGIRYDPFTGGKHPLIDHAIGFSGIGVQRLGRMLPSEDAIQYYKIGDMADQTALMADFEARAQASIDRPGYRTYVISSEFLPVWLAKPEYVTVFHDWLTERFDRVRYVVYLRDQIDWVPSAYAQLVKMGGVDTLEHFLERRGKRNYYFTCSKWLRGTGRAKLDVRLLERDFLANGDLIEDFASVIGADTAPTHPAETLNEAVDAETLQQILDINRQVRDTPAKWSAEKRGQAVTKLLKASSGRKLTLSDAHALNVARRNADSNERLRKRFFPDRGLLFPKSAALLSAAMNEEDEAS